MPDKHSGFAELSWDDLTSWAGSRVVSRARSYKTQVRDLRTTADGGLLAWVQGTSAYATHVWIDPSAALSSHCSCPYSWGPCKHSVAVILAFLDAVKGKQTIPEAAANDRRLVQLSKGGLADDLDEIEDYEAEEDADLTDQGEDGEEEDREAVAADRSRAVNKRPGKRENVLANLIEAMTKDELVRFVMELAAKDPSIRQRIEEEEQLRSGRVKKIVRSLRAHIEDLASEPAWRESWSGEGSVPDYSPVRERLELLLDAGYANEVLRLGKHLWRLGNRQVEESNDEGETAIEIGSCMDIVLRAVPESSLEQSEQILLIIDWFMQDDYSILDGRDSPLSDDRYTKTAWSLAADSLLARLNNLPIPTRQDDYSSGYERGGIMRWCLASLEHSGRTEEIIPLLEREAPFTHCYATLIEYLLSAGRRSEAHRTAVQGFHNTVNSHPGIAWQLEKALCEMAEADQDFTKVAAYRSLEFFDRPSLRTYQTLEKAVQALAEWPAVREGVLHFLEEGIRPDVPAEKAKTNKGSVPAKAWPLPATDISVPPDKSTRQAFPDTVTLMDIAIYEKRHDDVLHWYAIDKKRRFGGSYKDEAVAESVQTSHPEVSLKIWKDLAESQINQVKPSAYHVADQYLGKMRKVYERTERLDEWNAYLAGLRLKHKAKRTLMQVLDSLEGKRIIDT